MTTKTNSIMFAGNRIEAIEIPEKAIIAAGTMFLWPYYEGLKEESSLPEFTLLCVGQDLSRELYPELSVVLAGTGGFYHMTLPDLYGKFTVGFSEDGKPIKASGCIYYQSVPYAEPVRRSLR